MRRTATCAIAAATALAGCGGGNEAAVTSTPAPTATPAATMQPITKADANAYAAKDAPIVKRRVAAEANDTGKPTYECAPSPTEGQFDCEIYVSFRKLSDCGKLTIALTVGRKPDGSVGRIGDVKQDQTGQACYIGPNGEPVPDNPS